MSESVTVNTCYGFLRGATQHSFEGYDYCAFKGIPYAKPPLGALRFKDPVPLESWSGVRDASEFGEMCCQLDPASRCVMGSEDCLYLNVYVKCVKPNIPLPVMVWIHGGAFYYGSGDDLLYGPDYLLRKDIVLVTINYRLGVLGFLNFEDKVATGNQGLKDQIMALRWVQKNIRNFGGDHNNVTIFGESAGGVSVNHLALSPLAEGLFHKAICQSGTASINWSCTSSKESAFKLCKILGNDSKDPKDLIEFLRTVDLKKLVECQHQARHPGEKIQSILSFSPCIDNISKDSVIPISPHEAYKRGVHVPFIVGYNNREGIFNLRYIRQRDYDKLEENFESGFNSISIDLLKENNLTPTDFKRLYYGDEKISSDNADKFVEWWSDLNFVDGVHRTLKVQATSSSAPTYFYRFCYDDAPSITKILANSSMPGASHFDEVQYLFSMKLYDTLNLKRYEKGSKSYRIMEQMTELWTNFAKYGRPTITTTDLIPTYWLPINNDKIFRALNINEYLMMENILSFEERLQYGRHIRNKL
ncbi:esterase B1-like [Phymastichus coffea]|uniref:esterase B1-like n=1 Tax=Phymastichus coffea TaxID=108790 RepID=UPI00273C5AAA|nr:esterase B1-like [Phymastichus coffea]